MRFPERQRGRDQGDGVTEARRCGFVRRGLEVLRVEAVTSTDPHHRPERLDRSPAHAFTRDAWFLLWEAYCSSSQSSEAAAKLRVRDRAAPFPYGSFPPALPYVTA